MQRLNQALLDFVSETKRLDLQPSSTENTFYPAIKNLVAAVLIENRLPFTVKVNTSEGKGKGTSHNMPDFVLGDDKGFVGVFGEVKKPDASLTELAVTTAQNDQIGRYLAQTGVVIVSNVRSFGLLACKPGYQRQATGTVPPDQRDLIKTVDIWAAVSANGPKATLDTGAIDNLCEIIARAVSEYAPLAEPADLAKVLAWQARDAKDQLPDDLKVVKPLLDDYRQALGLSFNVDDEKGDRFFRSSLIQTAFYSLFAAWVLWDKTAAPEAKFEIDDAHKYLPIPFLDALLHDIRHPKRLKALGLEEHLARAIATLNRVDRFIFRARMTFPTIDVQTTAAAITYFYEPFLEAFDPKLRDELGVWYTPPEIVRYQVRRVHHILKTELERPRGLADPDVVVLDPCCGTGAYLLEVARCIADEAKADGDEAAIGLELTRAFHERIIGFEILTAPFAVAQLQLYLLLDSLGAKPNEDGRLAIFLTNALSGWRDVGSIKLTFPEMREEFDASQEVKRNAKIIVVIGNPPYDRFAGAAQAEEAELVAHYKGIELIEDVDKKTKQLRLDEFGNPKLKQKGNSALYQEYGVRKQLLDDLYIRFFRMAEERIGKAAEFGLVSFISNSSYLTGRSHPIMRHSLLSNFHRLWIDNLNGDKYRTGKLIPAGVPGAGSADQSAFTTDMDSRGIQPGTAIVTMLKRQGAATKPTDTEVLYRDFWGLANQKRAELVSTLPSGVEGTASPYEAFKSTRDTRWRLSPTMREGGFEAWPALDEIFPVSLQGVNHNRGIEGSVIDSSREALSARIQHYIEAPSFEEAKTMFPALAPNNQSDGKPAISGYTPETVWSELNSIGFDGSRIVSFLCFPLDKRYLYYDVKTKLLNRSRPEYSENLDSNEFLLTVPEPRKISESRPVFSTGLANLHVHERGSVVFPRETAGTDLLSDRDANIPEKAWRILRNHFGLTGERRDPDARCFVGKLFRVGFAMLHAPGYQSEHKSALSADWAHLPIPKDPKLFAEVVEKGELVTRFLDADRDARDVVELVLGKECAARIGPLKRLGGENLKPGDLKVTVTYWGGGKGRWKPRAFEVDEYPDAALGYSIWGGRTGDLFINDDAFFANVPEAVWTYQLGGYPTLKKWLGYRQADRRDGNPLSDDERKWFRQIVQRIAALLAIGAQLDALYQKVIEDAFTASELGIER